MLQKCYRGLTGVLHGCYRSVEYVLHEFYGVFTRVLIECFISVEEYYRGVTGV